MDVNAEKLWIIRELEKVDDINLLKALKHMIYYAQHHEGRVSIEQYNKEIEEAEERIKGGEFFTHDDVTKMSKEW